MLKKFFAAAALLSIAAALMSGCSAQEEQLPELVIGCDNYRPYCYIDEDGELAGLNVEIAQEVCKRMGYKPVFEQIEWSQRDALLESGGIDCLWSCIAIDGQEEHYTWIPYMTTRQVVVVMKDSPIQHLSELEGKSVAVRVSSRAEEIFLDQSEPGVPAVENVYCMTDLGDAVTALRNDYVDACAGYAAALREQLDIVGVDYRVLDEDLVHASLGVAFSKDRDFQVVGEMSQALSEMRSDGTLKEIIGKYVNAEKALGDS